MKFFILLISVIYCIQASQYVPIQNRYDGITLGDPNAHLHIEAFFDPLCPDSKRQNGIFNELFSTTPSTNLKFTYHFFPLPYHRNAFSLAQGIRFFVKDLNNTQAAVEYLNFLFEIQDDYTDTATLNKTHAAVIEEVTQRTQERLGSKYSFNSQAFATSLLPGTKQNMETRYSWKYGTSRGVSGTPLFLANGVVIDGAEEWELQEWKNFISQWTSGEFVFEQ